MKVNEINQLLSNLDAETLAAVTVLIQTMASKGCLNQSTHKTEGIVNPPPITLEKAISDLIVAKRASGLRDGYIYSLRFFLRMFADGQENRSIASIGVEDIETWLSVRCKTLGYRSTCLNRISSLFSFAVRRRWIPDNPCRRIERIRQNQTAPPILTVEQASKLLNETRTQKSCSLAYLALTLLGGVRPEEAMKLNWAHINLENATIHMDGAIAKTRCRRIVPLHPNAIAWLKLAKKLDSTLPVAPKTRKRYCRYFRAVVGWKAWPKDILRHTAASFWLAETQDAGKVARWLGNSAGVLMKHYIELATKEDAEKFWAIMP